MPSGYDTFKLFHAVSLHFTTDNYNFIKYQGKTNVTPQAWYKRSDKYHFETLGKKYTEKQLIGIFVSYYALKQNQPRPWGKVLLEHARTDYLTWLGAMERLPRIFEEDLLFLQRYVEKNLTSFKKLFVPVSGVHPPFIILILNKSISYETAIIFNKLTHVFKHFDTTIDEDIVWPDLRCLLDKYSYFLDIDTAKYKQIYDNLDGKFV